MYIQPVSRGVKFSSEMKDCSVRALANAAEMEYLEAHKLFEQVGRVRHEGSTHKQLNEVYLNNGFELFGIYGTTNAALHSRGCFGVYAEDKIKSGMTLKKFIKTHQDGAYILVIKGHAFAVIDGELIDDGAIKENVRICVAFKKD